MSDMNAASVPQYDPFALQHRVDMNAGRVSIGVSEATIVISRSLPESLRLDIGAADRDYRDALRRSSPEYGSFVEGNLREAEQYDACNSFRNPTNRSHQFEAELRNHHRAVANLPELTTQRALGTEIEQAITKLSRPRRYTSVALGALLMGAASLGLVEAASGNDSALQGMSESAQSYIKPDVANPPHFDPNFGIVGGGLAAGVLAGWGYAAARRRSFAQVAATAKMAKAGGRPYGQGLTIQG